MPAGSDGIPLTSRCTCGHVGAWLAAPGRTWQCPGCDRTWVADAAAVESATRGASELATLRRVLLGLLVATCVLAAVLVAVHPAWVLGAPALVGGTLLATQPTYRKRRARALARTRVDIPLSLDPSIY